MRSVGGYLRGQFSLPEQQQERSRAMANGDWRNEQDRSGSRGDERDRWRDQGREDFGRGGRDYGSSRGGWSGGREGHSSGGYGGAGQDYGRGYGQDFGRDYRGGGSQGRFGGNDYSRGNYGADQGYRQDYSRQSGDYGQQGRGERGLWDRASDEVSSWFGDDDAARRRRMDEQRGGQHRGRGPKGYTRSDDRIREDVNDRLSDDPFVDASEIEVMVSSCEVTLTGTVDSREAKRRAEDVAEQVSGVKHVQNNIRVQQPSSGTMGSASATTGTSGTGSSNQGAGSSR